MRTVREEAIRIRSRQWICSERSARQQTRCALTRRAGSRRLRIPICVMHDIAICVGGADDGELDQRYPHLQERVRRTATIGRPVSQLDVETVVKASQAVSCNFVLENLIKALMTIAVEHAASRPS